MDAATNHIAMGDPVSGIRCGGHGTGGVGLPGGGGDGRVGDAVGEAGETVGEAGVGALGEAEGVGQEPGGPHAAEGMITSPDAGRGRR
jgi:hypothetical protein